jgi:hypothetical protein
MTNNPINNWTNALNRQFSKEEVKVANKYNKKCSTSLDIKKMQTKQHWVHASGCRLAGAVKHLLRKHKVQIPVLQKPKNNIESPSHPSQTIIKKTNHNKCWWGCRGGQEEESVLSYRWEHKLVRPLWKSVWRFLKKLKIELLYDPAVSLLHIYPKECKSAYNRNTYTPMLIAALFTLAKLWNQLRCPLINKENMV